MKTDFTVVGRIRNHENILSLVKGVEDKGYSVYNFLEKPIVPSMAHLPMDEQAQLLEEVEDFINDPLHKEHFENDLVALKNADTFILLLPAGLASHMEAGIAYGLGKKLILIGEVEKPETLYLMFDEDYPNIKSFLATI